MDDLGPFFLDNLPLEFAGFDEALFIRLRDLVLRTGQNVGKSGQSVRQWPGRLSVLVSAVPGQLRLTIMDGTGMSDKGHLAMLFMDPQGQAYALLDRRITAALIREILDAEAPSN